MPKTPFPPGIPRHLTGFSLLKVGNLTLPGLLGRHLTFMSKRWSASQVKGSHHSFIQHVHCVHGSLLLYYSFISWSIKSNQQMGNLTQNEALSVGHLTFESKSWSASQSKGSSRWVILPFQLPTYILGNFFQKSQMPRSLQGRGKGGGGHGQLNIEIEWYMLFYLQWLQKLQVDNNIKYIEVDMWICRFLKYYIVGWVWLCRLT